jgi:hypothetical protein
MEHSPEREDERYEAVSQYSLAQILGVWAACSEAAGRAMDGALASAGRQVYGRLRPIRGRRDVAPRRWLEAWAVAMRELYMEVGAVGKHGRRPRWRRLRAPWLLASLVAVFLVTPTSAQAARDHCCFKVSAFVEGTLGYGYGSNPSNDYNGSGGYLWRWRLITFVEYVGGARGQPGLRAVGLQKGEAELREDTNTLTKRQAGTTTHNLIACQVVQGTGGFVRSNGSVDFSGAIPGQLHLVSPVNPGYNALCDHGAFAHEPTQLSGEFPGAFSGQHQLAREPWSYDVEAGPRKRYTQDRNFKLESDYVDGHSPDPQSNSPHEAGVNNGARVKFTFVPESELRKEIKKLRKCEQGCR